MVVAVLAVLKAGAAYVPLDPAYPAARLEYIASDARLSAIVTRAELAELLPQSAGPHVCLEALEPAPGDEEDLGLVVLPDQLAYVIYTSGSTGRPKGVLVSHRNVTRLLQQTDEWFRFGPDDVWTLFHSLSFDFSVWELWGPLLTGGRLVIVPYLVSRSPEAFARLLDDERVTVLNQTPSAFRQLLPCLPTDAATSLALRCVIFGGEALSLPSLARWYELYGADDRRLVNMYGITETTVHVTFRPIRAADLAAGRGSVIGAGIPDLHVYLLDAAGRAVTDGEPGEICVGGEGLARGYLNRPDLTAERFVPDPYSATPGARVYRSGDLARLLPDGDREYLGRIDHQVKIRGFRIETGEIEAALHGHPSVADAAVVAVAGENGDSRLIAYVVVRPEQRAAAREIRRWLASELPEHMVPAMLVELPVLPLTGNGKLDRSALPAPTPSRALFKQAYQAPATPTEARLCAIWSAVLGVEPVGVSDDFFVLGGDSLRATQALARVREELLVDLPLCALFAHRTPAGISAAVEEQRTRGGAVIPPLIRADRGIDAPLALAQERAWFLQELDPTSTAYQFQIRLRMRGPLQVDALRRSLEELIRRHEILRTTFPACDGVPVQRIHPPFRVELPEVDLSALTEAEQQAELTRQIRALVCHPFDHTRLPMVGWTLFRLGPDHHLLVHKEHHLLHDGWSWNVLLHELDVLYTAFAAGQPSPLPEPELQFADFAIWQRSWVRGDLEREQLEYWQRRLSALPAVIPFPTDYSRPQVQTFRGAVIRLDLPGELCDRLRELARSEDTTVFVVLLALFQVLIHRYSGETDIPIGCGVANRRWRGSESLLGMIVNSVVLRSDLGNDPSLRALIRQTRGVTLEAQSYQDVPFHKVVEALRKPGAASYTPGFQFMFSFHDAPLEQLRFGGLETELIEGLGNGSAKAELNVIGIPRREQRATRGEADADAGITLIWEYNTDLFRHETGERLLHQYWALLASAADDPETSLSALSLLPPGRAVPERFWAGDALDLPAERSIPALFAEWVRRTPDAVAIAGSDSCWTYTELNERAEALSRRLLAEIDVRGCVVALCRERSPETVALLLAILKSGAAYLPLDPRDPPERMALLLAQSQAVCVIAGPEQRERLPADVPVLDLATLPEPPSGTSRKMAAVPAEALAYVLFTSGSSGTPKAVAVPHRAVARLVRGTACEDIRPDDRFLQFAPLAFDASTFEIWGALLNGARLEVAPPGPTSLEELGAIIRYRGVTTLWLTAGLFHPMVDHQADDLRGVRRLLAGGDVLSLPHVRKSRELLPETRLFNGYGPTENTTFTTIFPVDAEHGRSVSLPIGKPIAGGRVYVLDDHLGPLPVGAPGDLYAAGDGLAWGYLGDSARTAAVFLPDPFSPVPGARMYRTGDRARLLEDGNLEFLGRRDSQVKLRGFRIEPGEIEQALRGVPGVTEVCVLARELTGRGPGLVAYFVTDGSAVGETELRGYLRQRLPEHMVPTAWMALDALPVTPNGKLDRAALPEPITAAEETGVVAPRSPLEETLAGIFREVLSAGEIGAHSHFFDLGGHSLLATRVISRVRDLLDVELPLRALFEYPTVAEFAEAVLEARGGAADRLPAIRPIHRTGELPLSFAQRRIWFVEQLAPGKAIYNIPFCLEIQGELDQQRLRRALGQLLERHETLRARFPADHGEPFLRMAPVGEFDLPIEKLSGFDEEQAVAEAERRFAAEGVRPFDLAMGPLFRARLLRLAPERHWLLVTVHHIVADGWSMDVLFRDLGVLYAGAGALPELPVQYVDWAAAQERWAGDERQSRLLEYWREQLAGAPSHLELPADHSRPAQKSFRGGAVRFTVPAERVRRLEEVVRGERATLFMALLAAFQLLLARLAEQDEVVVGTPVSGRTHSEVEGLVGLFVNVLPIRTVVSGAGSFLDLLRHVRHASLEAFVHADLPFDHLVEALNPARDSGRDPIFQVMFAMNRPEDASAAWPDHRVALRPGRLDTAKFDLTLYLSESPAGLRGSLEFSRDLFAESSAERIVQRFLGLLETVCAEPSRPVSHFPVLTAEESALIARWNDTETPIPNADFVARVQARAAAHPELPAVRFDDQSLSYGQLAERIAGYSGALRRGGVGSGERVGVLLERSLELPAVLLAVMGTGAAYLPLDPDLPDERLKWMLHDSGASLLIAERGSVERACRWGVPVVCREDLDGCARCGTEPSVSPEELAYVIYTSGSTGRPKGVEVTRAGLANLLDAMRERPGIREGDVLAAVTTFSFDIAGLELFLPLLNGATLDVLPRRVAADGELLAERLRATRATMLQATPATWRLLLEAGWTGCRELRVLCGGEAFPPDLADTLRGCCGEVWNLYGPTETTIWSSVHRVEDGGAVPVGAPIARTQIYVVDRFGQPAPIGVPGEVWIGGAGVARGYRGRPELTADRFVPDPFGSVPGSRVYRTGDLGRWRADGTLEILGRQDHQIKLRGFRIEPGEIEALLLADARVRAAVVVKREDEPGDERLVAYVAADPECTDDLLAACRKSLPAPLVPANLVALPALPLTANGKLNRAALPAPHATARCAETGARPQGPAQEALAELFALVLGVGEVAAHDSFFELGGHSLLAVRLVAQIKRRFDRNLPLAVLFQAPTVAGLAALLEQEGWQPSWSPLVPIQPRGSRAPLFMVHGVGGNVLRFHALSHHLGGDQPFYGLQAPGLDGSPVDYWTIEQLAELYLADIRKVQRTGPYRIGGWSFGGHVAVEMAHQLRAAGEEVELLALLETPGPGYPRFRPLPARLACHAANLARLKPSEWDAYIRKRVGGMANKLMWRRWYQSYRTRVEEGSELPTELRDVGLGLRNAHSRYRHHAYAGRIVYFRAEHQPVGCYPDPLNGWGSISESVEVRHVPGEHASIVEEPHVRKLAAELADCLRALDRAR